MALSRSKKRVLAQLLVREAKRIVAEWDQKWREANHGEESLSDVESHEVEETFSGWLRHLPDGAWEKVETPAVDRTAGHTSESYNESFGADNGSRSDNDPGSSSGIADHENLAVSRETPIMGDNDLHDEDEVLAVEEDEGGSAESEAPADHGGPFRRYS